MRRTRIPKEKCDLCNVRPHDPEKHAATPKHKLKAYEHSAALEGFVRCRGYHSLLRSVGIELRRGPIGFTHTNADNVFEGFYGPAWAVHVSKRVDVRAKVRKGWLAKLLKTPDLQQAFLGHLNLDGSPLTFFGVRRRDRAINCEGDFDRCPKKDLPIWEEAP